MPPPNMPKSYLMRLHIYNKRPHCGKGMFRLMSLVKSGCSLRGACREMGLAYSKAWKMIKAAEDDLGVVLIEGSTGGKGGGGSRLSEDGEALLTRFRSFEHEATQALDTLFQCHFGAQAKDIDRRPDMQFVNTAASGRGGAHYSAGVIHGGLLYVSGQLSIDSATGKLPQGGAGEHARQALANLEAVLSAAGACKTDVIQCRVYTPDVALWGEINAVYSEFFGEHRPARCIVPTGPLHYGCLVEIEAIAAVPVDNQGEI